MKLRTHISASILAASFSWDIFELASVSPLIIAGSLLPDIDTLSGNHRKTILHWYPAWLSVCCLGWFVSDAVMIVGLCGLLHVFLDSCTKMGVPSLFRTRMIGWKRIRTGGDAEFYVFCGILMLIPLVQFFRMGGSCFLKTSDIVNIYPHDRNAFTQGLVFENGFLYEGTGLYGKSSLRKTALETGEILQIHRIPDQFFGEGITIYENKIIQLTWKSKTGFVYDKDSFQLLKTFEYPTEGWGITHDGRQMIMSDGTATLYFLHPETFKETHRIEVSESGSPVSNINELEYILGEIYANVWQTDYIIRIDPETGNVIEKINLKGIMKFNQPVDVLNGIAYNAESETLLVTGKLWPRIFEIRLVEK